MLPASKNHHQSGQYAEQWVANHLKQQGYTILATNFAQRSGEIDIIAQEKSVIAFVEVKFRRYEYFNTSQVVVPSKQRKIIKTARVFLATYPHQNMIYRFDVALVHPDAYTTFNLIYITNAFTESERSSL